MSGKTNSTQPTGKIRIWSLLLVFVLALSILLFVLLLMSCGVIEWAYKQSAKSGLPHSGNAPTSGLRIVYVCSEGMPTYKNHICVMRADGTGQTLLTQDEGTSPVWSPGGKQIAFQSGGYDVMVMNADGSNLKKLAHGVVPWWMGDGKRISFIPCGPCDVPSLITPDGEPQGEFHTWNVGHFPLAASPDGTWIAYEEGNYVAVKHADGTGIKRLAHGVAPWWLDAERLGFTRISRVVINADGSGGPVGAPDQASAFAIPPSPLSSDGKRIAFDDHSSLYIMNVDGSGKTRLALGVDPIWSPDGKQIVFDDYSSIYMINADGSDKKKLAHGRDAMGSPQ